MNYWSSHPKVRESIHEAKGSKNSDHPQQRNVDRQSTATLTGGQQGANQTSKAIGFFPACVRFRRMPNARQELRIVSWPAHGWQQNRDVCQKDENEVDPEGTEGGVVSAVVQTNRIHFCQGPAIESSKRFEIIWIFFWDIDCCIVPFVHLKEEKFKYVPIRSINEIADESLSCYFHAWQPPLSQEWLPRNKVQLILLNSLWCSQQIPSH